MSTKKPLLLLIGCALLAACASSGTQSLTPSLEQIKTLVPTVACAEDQPSDSLPNYPQAPAEPATESALMAYSRAQSEWALQAIGAYRREKAKRAATASCLADLRLHGLIN